MESLEMWGGMVIFYVLLFLFAFFEEDGYHFCSFSLIAS